MANSPPTLHGVFLPSGESDEGLSSDRLKHLEKALGREFKGIRWNASMPDVVSKIGELLDIPISEVFVASWKKAAAIQAALDESKAAPKDTIYVDLAEHTITSTHHPFITVRIGKLPAKDIKFTVAASFVLKGFTLTIRRGEIQEVRTGSCDVEGTLECLGVQAKRKLERFQLPGTISLQDDMAPTRDVPSLSRIRPH